jgi:site-specific recombinase XerC
MLATCQSRSRFNFRGRRDEATLRLFATTGLRLLGLANLTVGDLDLPRS